MNKYLTLPSETRIQIRRFHRRTRALEVINTTVGKSFLTAGGQTDWDNPRGEWDVNAYLAEEYLGHGAGTSVFRCYAGGQPLRAARIMEQEE